MPAFDAVAVFEADVTSDTLSVSWTHTPVASPSFISVEFGVDLAITVARVSYGTSDVPMTLLGSIGGDATRCYTINGVPGGAQAVKIEWSAPTAGFRLGGASRSFTGPCRVPVTSDFYSSTTSDITVTVLATVVTDMIVEAAVSFSGNSFAAATGQTEDADFTFAGANNRTFAAYHDVGDAGSTACTLTVTGGGAANHLAYRLPVGPASAQAVWWH